MGLFYARAGGGVESSSDFYVTVEKAGAVLGCAMPTLPQKVLVTDLPVDAGSALAGELAARYDETPSVLGPERSTESVAMAWGWSRGCIDSIPSLCPPV